MSTTCCARESPDDARGRDVIAPKLAGVPPAPRRRHNAASAAQVAPSAPAIARRRRRIGFAKLALPALAACLLAAVALWPELTGTNQLGESARPGQPQVASGQILDARYRGVDEAGRRYTITAATATQNGGDLVNLVEPKGDIGGAVGPWLFGEARQGVFDRTRRQLDLSGDVTLYRSDGTILTTDTATMDLANGVAVSDDRVHVEGPFGTLDAQGFAASDGGKVVRFTGPGRLVLRDAGR
jgi:lipopolysaccharide export system protein LptC